MRSLPRLVLMSALPHVAACHDRHVRLVRKERPRLRTILYVPYALTAGAVGAAIHITIRLNTMANNFTTTMATDRRKCLHGTLEAVERVRYVRHDHCKGFVIVIAACFTPCHFYDLPENRISNMRLLTVYGGYSINRANSPNSCLQSVHGSALSGMDIA